MLSLIYLVIKKEISLYLLYTLEKSRLSPQLCPLNKAY